MGSVYEYDEIERREKRIGVVDFVFRGAKFDYLTTARQFIREDGWELVDEVSDRLIVKRAIQGDIQ